MATPILDLNFSVNWNNKLDADIFTTIRSINPYYTNNFLRNSLVQIKLDGKKHSIAKVMSKGIVKFGDIPQIVVMLDCGYRYEACLELFSKFLKCSIAELPGKEVVFLTLSK